MSTESDPADPETFTGPDGKTYRVVRDYVPLPPLPITSAEEKMVDEAIVEMVERFQRDGVKVERPRFVCQEEAACVAIDEILANGLWILRHNVPYDTAEKLFQRLGSISLESDEDALAVGVLFIRFFDTMEAMVSFKRKYRGKPWEHCKYTKEEALEILRQRGLTRR